MKSLLRTPCKIVAGVKEAGAGAFLAKLLDDAHPKVIAHVFAHQAAAQSLMHLPRVIVVADDTDFDAEQLLLTHQPDFVVVGASVGWSIEKSLTIAAKDNHIPVHAFIDNYMNTWQRFAHEINAQRWTYLPDRIFAISSEMAVKLESEGCPLEVIALTAHPVLADISSLKPSVPIGMFRKNLDIERAQIVLTLALESGHPDSELWLWDNIADEIDKASNQLLKALLDFALSSELQIPGRVVVLIKQHPTDKKFLTELLAGYPATIYRTIADVDKLALIDASTAVFGIGSMLLLEAAARPRVAFCLNIQGVRGYPFIKSFANLHILSSGRELDAALAHLSSPEGQEHFVSR